jgi:hypothetical protein
VEHKGVPLVRNTTIIYKFSLLHNCQLAFDGYRSNTARPNITAPPMPLANVVASAGAAAAVELLVLVDVGVPPALVVVVVIEPSITASPVPPGYCPPARATKVPGTVSSRET